MRNGGSEADQLGCGARPTVEDEVGAGAPWPTPGNGDSMDPHSERRPRPAIILALAAWAWALTPAPGGPAPPHPAPSLVLPPDQAAQAQRENAAEVILDHPPHPQGNPKPFP